MTCKRPIQYIESARMANPKWFVVLIIVALALCMGICTLPKAMAKAEKEHCHKEEQSPNEHPKSCCSDKAVLTSVFLPQTWIYLTDTVTIEVRVAPKNASGTWTPFTSNHHLAKPPALKVVLQT
jgi:hypothetical protein